MKVWGICVLDMYFKNIYIMKPLPFKGYKKKYKEIKKEGSEWVGNYYVSSKYDKIINILKIVNLKMPHIKQVVIDDER